MRALVCLSALTLIASFSGCAGGPGSPMNSAGQSFYDQGNYAQAAHEFQRAVAANPGNADFIGNLAATMRKQGNLAGAEQQWRHAILLNPSHQPSYHGLSQLLVETNRQQEAASLLSMWSASQPYSAEAQVEMAWLNRELGNSQLAEQHLQQAVRINPNHSAALSSLGQHYEDTGRQAAAMQMYQLSLENNWYQPEVQSRLATLRGLAPGQGGQMNGQLGGTTALAGLQAGPFGAAQQTRTAFGGVAPFAGQSPLAARSALAGIGMGATGGIPFPPIPAIAQAAIPSSGQRDYLFPNVGGAAQPVQNPSNMLLAQRPVTPFQQQPVQQQQPFQQQPPYPYVAAQPGFPATTAFATSQPQFGPPATEYIGPATPEYPAVQTPPMAATTQYPTNSVQVSPPYVAPGMTTGLAAQGTIQPPVPQPDPLTTQLPANSYQIAPQQQYNVQPGGTIGTTVGPNVPPTPTAGHAKNADPAHVPRVSASGDGITPF